jgi:hypothetical protein
LARGNDGFHVRAGAGDEDAESWEGHGGIVVENAIPVPIRR